MKKIIFFHLLLILFSVACKNKSNQEDISTKEEEPEMNMPQDLNNSMANDTTPHEHDEGNGKFGCIPTKSIILEANKFFTTKIPNDPKDYIFFKSAEIHTYENDKMTSYTQDSVYLEITNVALAYWNDAIEPRELSKLKVGICSTLIPHPGNSPSTQKFIFKRGAIFIGDSMQIEPHRLTCNCYKDCDNTTSVQYWN